MAFLHCWLEIRMYERVPWYFEDWLDKWEVLEIVKRQFLCETFYRIWRICFADVLLIEKRVKIAREKSELEQVGWWWQATVDLKRWYKGDQEFEELFVQKPFGPIEWSGFYNSI